MKKQLGSKWFLALTGLIALIGLTGGLVFAQTGDSTITVTACNDINANGLCGVDEDEFIEGGVEACLENGSGGMLGCLPVPATFTGLSADNYTVFLRFVSDAQGHYPTTGRTAVSLGQNETADVSLGAVYPIHPKGVAVHAQTNKVYVAFHGPAVPDQLAAANTAAAPKPYPFVAVIDGETDEVLYTIPGAEDGLVDPSPRTGFSGIGREPWGIGISGDGQYLYVGSFRDGLVSVIDPTTDQVLTNYFAGTNFQPTGPALNPVTGNVHFPDYRDGRVVILGTDLANIQEGAPFITDPLGFSPYEIVVADALQGFNFVTMRDAVGSNPFQIRTLNSAAPFLVEPRNILFENPTGTVVTGSPHAIGLWQESGIDQPRIFVTYADDPRVDEIAYPNPDKLLVYSFPTGDPKNILLRNANIQLGDYAEAGLIYDPDGNRMLGSYGGFPYDDSGGEEAACNNPARGGTYSVDFDGNVSAGIMPNVVVGNPPVKANNLQWKNPFEIAMNPNNGKIYVTDRCWNDFIDGGRPGGGAVLIFDGNVTIPPAPDAITLAMNGPAPILAGQTASVTVEAQGVPSPGLYGVQFDINYNPALVTAANLQVHPDLDFVVISQADNGLGRIRLVASRQGSVPGLTGNIPLLTFDITAADTSGLASFTFDAPIIANAGANPFILTVQNYSVTITQPTTPQPTSSATPTSTPTNTPEPTATATAEPTNTPEPTLTPTFTPTATPEPAVATLSGQVTLSGRPANHWADTTVTVDDTAQSAVTTATGAFTMTNVSTGPHSSISADADGFLAAVCSSPTVTAPVTNLLPVTLLNGDVNNDNIIDITDATTVGADFGNSGPALTADLNRDGTVDILDIILVSINFGLSGPQPWSCQ